MTIEQAIIESIAEGVLAFDERGQTQCCNTTCRRLLGIPEENALASINQFLPPHIITFMQELRYNKRIPPRDLLINGKILQVTGTSLQRDQDLSSFAIILNDISEIRRLELVRSDFIANVSHELRTPIASVRGSLETLVDLAQGSSEDTQRFLSIAHRNSERLGEIVEDLLMLSRLEADELQHLTLPPVDLYAITNSARDLCLASATTKAIPIEIELLHEQSIEIPGHANLLEQAIVNLIDNAIKHSEEHDVITVQLGLDNHGARIEVRDSGCGIPDEKLKRIFERFYRVDESRSRSSGGSGLGLAIVKHIVHLHRGTITVASTVGVGSTFSIEIPHTLSMPPTERRS